MIFVTIGSQEPFDRLIQAIDEVAPSLPGEEIVAQVFKSTYKVSHIRTIEFISPLEYNNYIKEARLIIAHAGMGTILSVMQLEKPLLIFPRLSKYRETRNDHQVATAEWFEKNNLLHVAYETADLGKKIHYILNNNTENVNRIGSFASPELISSIKEFIDQR